MDLLRYALAHLRGNGRRTLAAFLAAFTAVTSFVLLTGSATTQRLEALQTLEGNFRGAYDILVRPANSTTQLERDNGQVRSTFLSGVYGGITFDQVEQIKRVPGTEAAAPIVMLGAATVPVSIGLDVEDLLPADQERAVVRFTLDAVARQGHLAVPAGTGYLYVTRQPFTYVDHSIPQDDGSTLTHTDTPREVIDGVERFPCANHPFPFPEEPPPGQQPEQAEPQLAQFHGCFSLASRSGRPAWQFEGGKASVPVHMQYPVTIAAIDPEAESRLLGLDDAIVAGRPLTNSDTWTQAQYVLPEFKPGDDLSTWGPTGHRPYTPALLAQGAAPDLALRASLEPLSNEVAEQWARQEVLPGGANLLLHEATPVGEAVTRSMEGAEIYDRILGDVPPTDSWVEMPHMQFGQTPSASLAVSTVLRPGEVEFAPGTPLTALPVPHDPDLAPFIDQVPTLADTAFRPMKPYLTYPEEGVSSEECRRDPNPCWFGPGLQIVGHFDPTQLREGGELGRVPLETYTAAQLLPADDATRAVVSDALLPDLNPAGYAQMPPALVVPIASLPLFNATGGQDLVDDAPVSAVRVRVAGILDVKDDASMEKLRLVAEQIQQATGLDVDIMAGTSQLPQRVELPATDLGVPALSLDEMWSKKGVAVMIRDAVDAKSVVLFTLILASSALTLAVVARASVAARRRELGVLKATGWPGSQLTTALLLESGMIGLAAGVLGALAAWPLSEWFGIIYDPLRALLAVPIAVALTMLASLAAALDAGRLAPITALAPPVIGGRGSLLRVRGPIGLGLVQALRRPGRLLAGTIAVALGVGSLVLLLTIAQQFSGAVVGTLLGNAVALQVRPADLAAAVMLAVMALIAVAVILFLGLTEDARGYASLAATGWRHRSLGVAIVTQGVLIALIGAALGAAAAYLTLTQLLAIPSTGVWELAGIIGSAAIGLAALVALAPAIALGRLPVAQLLSQE